MGCPILAGGLSGIMTLPISAVAHFTHIQGFREAAQLLLTTNDERVCQWATAWLQLSVVRCRCEQPLWREFRSRPRSSGHRSVAEKMGGELFTFALFDRMPCHAGELYLRIHLAPYYRRFTVACRNQAALPSPTNRSSLSPLVPLQLRCCFAEHQRHLFVGR